MPNPPRREVWAHPRSFAGDADRQASVLAASGVTRVRLAASYHAGRWLLTESRPGQVAYLPDSIPMFAVDAARYGTIAPVDAGATGAPSAPSDSFGTAAAALRRAGLGVVAWVVALHNSPLARAHPQWAIQNVFGDRYEHALCPASDEVRQYAATLIADCAGLEVDAVDVEALGFLGWHHDGHHHKVGIPLRPIDVYLLSLCVCMACRVELEAHGADVEAVARRARAAITQRLTLDPHATPSPPAVDADDVAVAAAAVLGPADHAAVQAARAAVVQRLVGHVAASTAVPVDLRVSSHDHEFTGKASGDLAGLLAAVDAVTVTSLVNDASAIVADLESIKATAVAPAAVSVGLSLDSSWISDDPLAALLERLEDQHVGAITWYAHDLSPTWRLTQVLRMAGAAFEGAA